MKPFANCDRKSIRHQGHFFMFGELQMLENIKKLDASLYVDVPCGECGKLMAMSNAMQINNKYYCESCIPKNQSGFNLQFIEQRNKINGT